MNTTFVLFDLDGTLLDSNHSLNYTLNQLLAKDARAPLSLDATRGQVSGGAGALLKAAIPNISTTELEIAREAFFEIYRNNLFYQAALFPGIFDLLSQLKQRTVKMGIATNKQSEFALPVITHVDLDPFMDVTLCRDHVKNPKPHPEMIVHACEVMEVHPKQCLFVGDDVRDIEAGKRAGAKTAIAAYGYGNQHEFTNWGADHIIANPEEILQLL